MTTNTNASTLPAAIAADKSAATAASRQQNKAMKNSAPASTKLIRISSALLLTGAVALTPSIAQHGKDIPVNVTSINTRRTAQGGVVTLSADTPINKTQTWQDADGKFHLVLPHAGQSSIRSSGGVKVQRVGDSLEIVVPVRPGASVMVQPRFNHLDLVVNGDAGFANASGNDNQALPSARLPQRNSINSIVTTARLPRERRSQTGAPPAQAYIASPAFVAQGKANATNNTRFPPVASGASSPSNYSGTPSVGARAPLPFAAQTSPAQPLNSATSSNASSTSSPPALPAVVAPANNAATVSTTSQASTETTDSGGLLAFLFSTTGVILAVALGLITFLVLRWRKNSGFEDVESEETSTALVTTTTPNAVAVSGKAADEQRKEERRKKRGRRKDDVAGALIASNPANAASATPQRQSVSAANNTQAYTTTELFGAYRVDQEVGKLMLGQPHRMDVLSSRAPDDRRALEVSLLKSLNAPDTGEDGHRRARVALEEYGFVARQSAALLLAPDAYERANAAQTLGEIGSSASLQFLLEALYDAEAIVRTRAVESLGALQLPSAIGALLDMARRHPEMPSALLSRALSACSVDTFDIFGTEAPSPRPLLSADAGEPFTGDITNLEPSAVIEQLPEWLEDEALVGALNDAENPDAEIRAIAARALAQFQVQRSVAALTELASRDAESSVRATAVTSLGAIDHESVFAPVIIAFGDEAREVRAAAARSLSRLNFDRADAYVRVAETADAETMREVARACIKAGMAGQAIDRLASEDRRPAYEAFSLLSLLAKSGETAPITDAIEHHADMNVRLSAVRLLGLAGGIEAAGRLRQLAVRDSVPEKVRSAVLEVVYKMDQAQIV